MLNFLSANFNEIISILISLVATTLPIPMIVQGILKKFDQINKTKFKITDAEKKIVEITVKKSELESFLKEIKKTSVNQETNTQQSATTPIQPEDNEPPEYNYKIIHSSKRDTLEELYEKRNTDKLLKKISFTIAVVMSIVGTIILFSGILVSIIIDKDVIWITTSSGAIIELVAGVYFWLVNRTMKEVRENSVQLEKTENLLTAIELVERISDDKVKDETYRNMIENLLQINH